MIPQARVLQLATELFQPARHIKLAIREESTGGGATMRLVATVYSSQFDGNVAAGDYIEHRRTSVDYDARVVTLGGGSMPHAGGPAILSSRDSAAMVAINRLVDLLTSELADRTAKNAGRRSA